MTSSFVIFSFTFRGGSEGGGGGGLSNVRQSLWGIRGHAILDNFENLHCEYSICQVFKFS